MRAADRSSGNTLLTSAAGQKRGALPAKSVKIPGMLVDFVVVEPTQTQTFFTEYSPAYAGELRSGAVRPGPIYARMWLDQEMKKKMGY